MTINEMLGHTFKHRRKRTDITNSYRHKRLQRKSNERYFI